MTTYGITDTGFTLKRNYNIIADIDSALALVQDPVTGETLNLSDENDPLNQLKNAIADQLAVCWEQLQMAYNQFDPLKASGVALSSLVQINNILRNVGETDTALRIRQQAQVAGTGAAQIQAIYSAVAGVTGVTFCRAYQNSTTQNPDSRGIPAKSLAVVAVGGSDADVANAIFLKSGSDAAYYGSTSVNVADSVGTVYPVKFVRPAPININIVVNLVIVDYPSWPLDGDTQIKNAIVAYSQYGQAPNIGLPPGADVIASRLYTPINSVQGHLITSVQVARVGDTLGSEAVIAWNEVANITAANITVNLS